MENPFQPTLKPVKEMSKSKKAFTSSLAKLMIQGMPLEKINVSVICREASLSRTTFYANYSSVEEVLNDLVDAEVYYFAVEFNSLINTGFDLASLENLLARYIDNQHGTKVFPFLVSSFIKEFYDKWTDYLKWRLFPFFAGRQNWEIELGVYAVTIQYSIRYCQEKPDKYTVRELAASLQNLYRLMFGTVSQ